MKADSHQNSHLRVASRVTGDVKGVSTSVLTNEATKNARFMTAAITMADNILRTEFDCEPGLHGQLIFVAVVRDPFVRGVQRAKSARSVIDIRMHPENCSPELKRLAECRLPLPKPGNRGKESGAWLPSFLQNFELLTLQHVEFVRDLFQLRFDETNIRVTLRT